MQVTRWRRYGKDRLYVQDPAGRRLGWWDLVTDQGHPAEVEVTGMLADAAAAWRGEGASLTIVPHAEVLAHPPPPGPGPLVPTPGQPIPLEQPSGLPAEDVAADPQSLPLHDEVPVTDLIWNHPGEQLAAKITAAREAGERPTFWRRLRHGKEAWSTWERGAIGERLVAEELVKLVHKDPRWGSSTQSLSARMPTSTSSSSARAGYSPSTRSTTSERGSGSAATPS